MTDSLQVWLDKLCEKRRRWVEASHDNDFDRGIWNATVEKYADPTHFIFELLQNAEDTGATRANFILNPDAIVFEHNGRPFDRDDIEGITGIGNTTKLEEANKIGCFGIGFKSVYVVTKRPEVHCTIEGLPIAFAITDLVVPELIATSHTAPTTRIVLPLPPAVAEATVNKVYDTLNSAGPRSLLFLQNLTQLNWSGGSIPAQCVVQDGDGAVRSLRLTMGSELTQTDRFIVLARQVERENDSRDYTVKIALKLNDAGDVVAEAAATRLAVFFETQEPTGLFFQVHGPFQLTDNRANIKLDNAWNAKLIDELSRLLADSLPGLRDRGSIKRNFLEVMPNKGDDISETWRPILSGVVQAFHTQSLLPAHSGGHVAAQLAVKGPQEIRDLLGDQGLRVFGSLPENRWAVGVMRSSRADVFLTTLGVTDWGYAEFLHASFDVFRQSYDPTRIAASTAAKAWFDELPDDHVQRFYLLIEASTRVAKRSESLSSLDFVRIEDGTRRKPTEVRLIPADASVDEEAAAHGLVLVRSALIRAGRARGKEVEDFLRKIGVKDVGERDYLTAILRANYSNTSRSPSSEQHLRHMRRILRWYEQTKDAAPFLNTTFLRAEGIEGYHQASMLYLDAPFVSTGLARIYGGQVKGRERRLLWSGYSHLKRAELVALLALLKAISVEDALTVIQTKVSSSHPDYKSLVLGFSSHYVTYTGTDIDYTIPQLAGLIALKDPDIGRMIWNAVSSKGRDSLYALYAPNQRHAVRRDLSSLAVTLREAEWIPAKDGTFRRPRSITATELAAGLSSEGNDAWLNVLDFGAEHRQRSEFHQATRRAAEEIGLPAELVDQLGQLSPDARKLLGEEMLRRIASGAFTPPEFPERSAPNPERRAERLAERARAAPEKTYESRARSVRTSDKEARQMARPYLRDLYTNEAGDMICQACHDIMPFRLADGTPYFEAPELIQTVSTELPENHLALCPTCCAKWQHANDASDAELREVIQGAEAPEIHVTLAGQLTRLRFVRLHFDDLRTIFDAASQPSSLAGVISASCSVTVPL